LPIYGYQNNNMTGNYLKTARANGTKSDSKTSEADLIQNNVGIRASFEEMNSLRAKIIKEKIEATEAIDLKYRDELRDLEDGYATMLSLSR
jgi:hypothetical protein